MAASDHANAWPAWRWWLLGTLCLGGIAGFRVILALWPSLGDAALFLYFGQRMNEGATLYRDIWDLKPPVIYLVNAAADLTGAQIAGVAVLETIALAVGGWLIWLTLRAAQVWPPAAATGLLFDALMVSYDAIAEGGNYTETWVIPFACLSTFLFVRALPSGAPALLLGAGAAACLAAFAKLPGLAPLLAQGGFLIAMLLVPGRRLQALNALVWIGAGFLAALAALSALTALATDPAAALDGSLLHPINYAKQPLPGSGHSLGDQTGLLLALVAPLLFALLAAGLAAANLLVAMRQTAPSHSGLLLPGRELGQYCGLLALWALADFAGALGTGRNYGHYFMPFVASGAAVSAVMIGAVRASGARKLASALLLLLAASLLLNAVNAARMTWWRVASRPPGAEAAVHPGQQEALVAIRARARPGDTLAVWENMHALYLLGGVRNALPHLALVNAIDSDHALRTKAPEMLRALEACPPTFLVLLSNPSLGSPGARVFEARVRRLAGQRFGRIPLGPRSAEHGTELWVRRGAGPISCPNI